MKCEIIILILALCGAFASPIAEIPEARAVSPSCQSNLTINTTYTVQTQQAASLSSLSVTFSSLGLAYLSPPVFTAYNWFSTNYGVVGTQLTYINIALTTTGSLGVQTIKTSMQTIVAALEQANSYYSVMSPTEASAISVQIQAIKSMQAQIISGLKCANAWQFMSQSCDDAFFTLIAQFIYQSSTVMMTITQGWCDACTSDTSQCAVAPATTTTTTSTTTSTTTTTSAPQNTTTTTTTSSPTTTTTSTTTSTPTTSTTSSTTTTSAPTTTSTSSSTSTSTSSTTTSTSTSTTTSAPTTTTTSSTTTTSAPTTTTTSSTTTTSAPTTTSTSSSTSTSTSSTTTSTPTTTTTSTSTTTTPAPSG